MAEHPPCEPLAPPAASAPLPLAAERAGVDDASYHAPWPDPAAIARDVTARLHPLIDHAVQHAVAPLAQTIAQQTTTIERLATALRALHAALPNPVAPEMAPDAPARHPHALQAYQDAQQDIANREDAQQDIANREDAQQDRRVADRRTRDAVGIVQDRRVADRRAQQDRDRFEDAVMAQYVPPPLAAAPPHPPPDTPPAS